MLEAPPDGVDRVHRRESLFHLPSLCMRPPHLQENREGYVLEAPPDGVDRRTGP